MRPTLLSLCTGYGGLDLAVEEVLGPVEMVALAELDPHAALVAEKRFAGVPNLGDIRRINWRTVMPGSPVDILTAGYPRTVPAVQPRGEEAG